MKKEYVSPCGHPDVYNIIDNYFILEHIISEMSDSMDSQVRDALISVQKALDDIQWINISHLKNRDPLAHFALQMTRSNINKAISAIDHLKATVKKLPH